MNPPNSQINFDQLNLPPDDTSRLRRVLTMLRERKMALIGLVLILAGVGGAGLYSLQLEEAPTDGELWQTALGLIDESSDMAVREEVRAIVARLDQQGFRDPDFAGGMEFLKGIIAFRDAQEQEGEAGRLLYAKAADLLHEAERQALVEERRPEWAYALGMSLARTERPADASSLLQESIETYEAGRIDAVLTLADIFLHYRKPTELERSLPWLAAILADPTMSPLVRDSALLLQARVQLALGETEAATDVLRNLSTEASRSQGAVVFRAQTLMARGEYRGAVDLLRPVADGGGLDQTYARQALYLMGRCAESAQEVDTAVSYYKRVAKIYPNSDEALAADLHAGDLLRRDQRTEEALNSYRRVLGAIGEPSSFHSRWLTIDELRTRMELAWNGWVAEHSFNEAIALARLMPPLLEPAAAARLEAAANEEWVLALQREYDDATFTDRKSLAPELRRRWRASGDAFGKLAGTLAEDPGDALWTSAAHYRRGNDAQSALRQLTLFLDSRPADRAPRALVWRGEVLMDLDRLDEALEHFQEVIIDHPKNEAAFTARYVIGRCHFERDEPDLAEKAWRDVLESPVITPDAREWRMALFSLGKLLYYTADLRRHDADALSEVGETIPSRQLLTEAYGRWDEAIQRLEEFLKRYPQAEEAVEARYLLAKSLQRSAERPKTRLQSAETDNARNQLTREMNSLLTQAIHELRQLQTQLNSLHEVDHLDELGQHILQDCYFEIAHTYYALEDYDRAIQTYQAAANRFPETAEVLLAYVQMTNCYDRLNKPQDARSMLEQASVILDGLPDDVFASGLTTLSKDQWKTWLEWAKTFNRDGTLTLTGGA